MNVWERFEGIANKEEVNEAKLKFEPIEEGVYKVRLDEIKPAESKDGLPMIKGVFTILEGKPRKIFYNQNLQNLNYPNMTAVNIAEAVKFISDLVGEEYEYISLPEFADYISSIPTGCETQIKVSYTARDVEHKFPKLKIVEKEVYEVFEVPNPEDLPF